MLPASDLAEILTNLSALNLQPNITAAVLGAVLAPLMRSADPQQPAQQRQRAERPRVQPRKAAQPKRKYQRGAPDARDRAHAALKANPDISLTKVAAIAGVSRSTVCNAARELAAEARKQARKAARQQVRSQTKPVPTDRRERARGFLRDELADGPKQVSDVEAAAERAHVDPTALAQARGDLGVVTSRGNAGGVMAVQWSLPG
jgi:hypothetical protein